MNQVTIISLVRHGHIVNPEDVFHGRLPNFPLSEMGRQQVEATAETLTNKGVVAIYSSPMLRARQTARILHRHLRPVTPVRVSQRLNEIYSPYDGSSHVEMNARHWDFYTGIAAPYEQPEDVLRRIRMFIARMRRRYPGRHVLGVSHADPISFTLLWALGQPRTPQNRTRLVEFGLPDPYPMTASISSFTFVDSKPDTQPLVSYFRPYATA